MHMTCHVDVFIYMVIYSSTGVLWVFLHHGNSFFNTALSDTEYIHVYTYIHVKNKLNTKN